MIFGYESRKTKLSLNYNARIEAYSRRSENNNVRHNAGVSFTYLLTETITLGLNENYALSPDLTEVTELGIITRRSESYRNSAGISISIQPTDLFSVILGYNNQLTEYKNASFFDSRTDEFSSSFNYKLYYRDTFSIGYRHRINTVEGENLAKTHTIFVGGTHQASEELTVSASGGLTIINVGERTEEDAYISFNLAKTFKNASLNIGYRADVATSVWSREVILNQGINLSLSNNITNKFNTTISGGYATSKSLSLGYVDVVSYNARLSLGYTFSPRVSGGIVYSFSGQEAASGGGTRGDDVNRNVVEATLTISY